MAGERLDFLSPLLPDACARRLQQLAAQPGLRISLRDEVTEVVLALSMLALGEQGDYEFSLSARCHDRSHRKALAATTFIHIQGGLATEPEGHATHVAALLRSGSPPSLRWWVLQITWYAVLVGLVAVLLISAYPTGASWLWEAAGGTVLLIALLYVIIVLRYGQAVRAVTTLLERALAARMESEPTAKISLM